MQKINTSRTLLSVALLGAFAVAPLLTPATQADPPSQAPAYGRKGKDKDKGKKDKGKKDKGKKDKGRDDDRRDNDRDDDRDDRDNYGRNATYTGVVTNVRNNGFDLRSNGRTYTVYTSSVPRDLSEGDEVRVYGRLSNDNDIRNASVRITRNRGNNDGRGNYGDSDRDRDYRTVTGVVTNVRNSREFEIRAGNTTYTVYAVSSTSGLNEGDVVRVYGRRSGNDLRDANVRITDNRDGDRNDNRDGNYETFRGQVVKVRNSREFDIRVGIKLYNVYASSATNDLSIGDEVRVYGSRLGSNDIRNANVSITRNR